MNTPMKINWLSAFVIGGSLALPIVAQEPKPAEKPPVEAPKVELLKVGSSVAEALSMKDLDGKSLSFKELRGKVVIVHFWSDRCPAEVHGDPITKRLEKIYEGKDVVILGIAANQNELGAEPPKDADYAKQYKSSSRKPSLSRTRNRSNKAKRRLKQLMPRLIRLKTVLAMRLMKCSRLSRPMHRCRKRYS